MFNTAQQLLAKAKARAVRANRFGWFLPTLLASVLSCASATAMAAEATIALQAVSAATQPSGSQFQYSINYTCSQGGSTDTSCNNMVVTIPLPAPVSDWPRTLTGAPDNTTSDLVGGNLVITLPPSIDTTGSSLAFFLSITPPNGTTPNNTTWTIQATLSGSNIGPDLTTESRTSIATAETTLRTSKLNNGVSYGVTTIGSTVNYSLSVQCNPNNSSTGVLNMDWFELVDTLPDTVSYVSSNPEGVYDAATHTVTWRAMAPQDPANPNTVPFPRDCVFPDPANGVTVQGAFQPYSIIARINDGSEVPPKPVVPPPIRWHSEYCAAQLHRDWKPRHAYPVDTAGEFDGFLR